MLFDRNNKGFAVVAILVLVALLLLGNIVAAYGTVAHMTVTMNRIPERTCVTSGGGNNTTITTSCWWFVYTDKEVFKDTDSLFFFKFNSADIANGLQPGKTYCVKVNMFRVPFMSWFRNVLSFKEGACGGVSA